MLEKYCCRNIFGIIRTMKSRFISFEGPDGSGKTTVLQEILPELSRYQEIVATREPGGVRVAEEIRNIVQNPENIELDVRSEMLLYAAARRVHFQAKIEPALRAGKFVITDRFVDSSVAYQSYGRGLEAASVNWLNNFATTGLLPDLTILFDIEVEVALARMHKNNESFDRTDNFDMKIHQRVRTGYLELAAANPRRFVTVDASQPLIKVKAEVLAAIVARFPLEFGELR